MERMLGEARELVGTRHAPYGFDVVRERAAEAEAYHRLAPYPTWHFGDWKVEERGPLPRCMPFVRTAVRRSARWLFGRPLQIHCPGNAALERWLRQMWVRNRMPSRMVAAAERAGVEGGVCLKFAYDAAGDPPLSLQILSPVEHVRLYHDGHNRDRLLMARVQYPYWDAARGAWLMYREEWTAEEQVQYRPQPCRHVTGLRGGPAAVMAAGDVDPDRFGGWEIGARTPNPFGLIPLVGVKNLDAGAPWGSGDLWDLFRVVDRVNLTYHAMDRSNQFDSEPNVIFVDLEEGPADLDRPLTPGQPLAVKSEERIPGQLARGQVVVAEAKGALRPAMMEYARDLRRQVLLAAGNVDLDPAEITNNGRLTGAVFHFIYAPLIELTAEKRKTYGEDGLAPFLEACAVGLRRAGVPLEAVREVDEEDEASFDVQLRWPPLFDLSEEEKAQALERVRAERDAGLTTAERAVEMMAVVEGVSDVQTLKRELGVAE